MSCQQHQVTLLLAVCGLCTTYAVCGGLPILLAAGVPAIHVRRRISVVRLAIWAIYTILSAFFSNNAVSASVFVLVLAVIGLVEKDSLRSRVVDFPCLFRFYVIVGVLAVSAGCVVDECASWEIAGRFIFAPLFPAMWVLPGQCLGNLGKSLPHCPAN